MILELDGWCFELSVRQTEQYSDRIASGHCPCGYCRNFYAAIDTAYPQLRQWLKKFGVNVEAPEELMPFEPTLYEATYCVNGRILAIGRQAISVGALQVLPIFPDQLEFEPECPHPYFGLVVQEFPLPWVLDEDMDEVISPANEPEYLEKMWSRQISKGMNDIPSCS